MNGEGLGRFDVLREKGKGEIKRDWDLGVCGF